MNRDEGTGALARDRRSRTILWAAAAGVGALFLQAVVVSGVSFAPGSIFRLPFIAQIVASGIVIGLALRGKGDRSAMWVVSALWLVGWFATVFEVAAMSGIYPVGSPLARVVWLGQYLLIAIPCLLHLIWTRPSAGEAQPATKSAVTDRARAGWRWLWVMAAGTALVLAGSFFALVTGLTGGIGTRHLEVAIVAVTARLPIIAAAVVVISLTGKEARGAMWIVVAGFSAAGLTYLLWLVLMWDSSFLALLAEIAVDLLIAGGGLGYLMSTSGRRWRTPEPAPPPLTGMTPA